MLKPINKERRLRQS